MATRAGVPMATDCQQVTFRHQDNIEVARQRAVLKAIVENVQL